MNIGFEAKRIFHNKTGLGNYSRDLVRILSRFFPQHHLLLYNPKPAKQKLYEPDAANISEKRPSGFINRKLPNLWRQKRIVSDLRKDEVDLFHGLSGEIPSGLRNAGIKSIVTIHDLIFLKFPQFYSYIDRQIHTYKFRKSVKNADRVIAISEQTSRDIVEYFGIPKEKITVVYQGCQEVFKQVCSEEEKEKVRQKFKLPSNFLLNVGTIEERKNILAGIKAIKDIDTHLVIIGSETSYAGEIRTYLQSAGMERKVSFLKGVSSRELAALYQMAELFLYPSLYEGFGIPIIEALYSGTPVITSKGSCFPEAGGPDSVYTDPHNPSEIGSQIKRLLSDPAERTRMAEAGKVFVRKFDDHHIASHLMQVYQEVMGVKVSS